MTFVAHGSVGSDDRLFHLWALVLGDQRSFVLSTIVFIARLSASPTRNLQPGHIVLVRELEAEPLCIVIDVLNLVKQQ